MSTTRRQFLAASATLAAAPGLHAAGDDLLKVGLIGCGGRGTGAATQALRADTNVKLVAMADAFEDRLAEQPRRPSGDEKDVAAKVDVTPDAPVRRLRRLQERDRQRCDVVLLCTPPHFRPHAPEGRGRGRQARLRREAGAPSMRPASARCWRPARRRRRRTCRSSPASACATTTASARRSAGIHDGAIGESSRSTPTTTAAAAGPSRRQPDWTDMTYQMRNWYNFTWLSGDFNVEQHVHFLDVCAWVMKDQYPVQGHRHGRPAGAHRDRVRPHLRPLLGRLRVRRRREA